MSMQSYGFSELKFNMTIAKSIAQKEYNIMERLIQEQEPDGYDMQTLNCSPELNQSIENFVDKIYDELTISIYPYYISSEAEGTELQGSTIWCIELELSPKIMHMADGWESWSEFG